MTLIENRILTLRAPRIEKNKEGKRSQFLKTVAKFSRLNLPFNAKEANFSNDTNYLGGNILESQPSPTGNLQEFYGCCASMECQIKTLMGGNTVNEKAFSQIDFNGFQEEHLSSLNLKQQLVSSLKRQVTL